ncbi:hypothetical protein [Streptomyces hiroshimensis]|uniref:Uncharacterized protein n=1 Tax=Streptomyces hiroshimensis TaxID=66424 RepID=A0ABQ2Z305_9ACTN|nr:hypothetical protein [Streptomyces hiroshimensis]GGY01599.1 hypothetical protein GCM10010324_55700 [Streptomyces hiroshimensis]
MIITTDLDVSRLAAAWEHIRDTSPAEEAVPLVLDCARRLAADPGGEEARIWVSGLVAMSGYLAWRPEQEAERAALDALRAAVEALGGRPCSHERHPYEAEMDSLEDEIWNGDTGLLTGRLAAPDTDAGGNADDPERVLCPGNVAGWARLAADVIAPLTVRRIPVGAPKYHHSCISTLSGIVNDYPYGDPHEDLKDEAACLPSRPTRGVLAGYLVTMNATCWYATSERITDRSVLDAMIKGVEEAVALLEDRPCTHGPGEHPDTRDPDYTNQVGYFLRSPGGRAEIAEYYGWNEEDEADQEDEPLDAWVCPDFLRDLAEDTLVELSSGLRAFEPAHAGAPEN